MQLLIYIIDIIDILIIDIPYHYHFNKMRLGDAYGDV